MCVLEAMAHGVPVIATDVGGTADVVEDGKQGFVVTSGDIDAMVLAIDRLLGDANLRCEMGAAGIHRIKQNYTAESTLPDLEALYRSLGAHPQLEPHDERMLEPEINR